MVRAACAAGLDHATAAKHARSHRSGNAGTAVVDRGPQPGIRASGRFLLRLTRRKRQAALATRSQLGRSRPNGYAARASVVTYMADRDSVDNSPTINVSDVCYVDAIYGSVVIESPASPIAALIADPCVAEAVIDSSIESNRQSPIPGIPHISPVVPTPITWSPQCPRERRHYPGAGNPVVTIRRVPRPVSWRPDITRTRAKRLAVNG